MANVRLALRGFVKAPVFTAVAVLSLALAIGANTALFGLLDQIILRMLPVERPQELVQFRVDGGRVGDNSGDGVHTFSHPAFLALRDPSGAVLSGLTGHRAERVSLVGDDRSEMVEAALVAGNFFEVFGVRPSLGRVLGRADDAVRNGAAVAVLQHDFWRTRFSGDPRIVGRTLRLNGTPFTVVGVAAPGFIGVDTATATNLWVPVTMKTAITPTWDDLENERSAWFYLFGRLEPGVSFEQAQASLKVLYRQRQEEELKGEAFQRYPDTRESFLKQTFSLVPAARGQSGLRNSFSSPLIVLQWLVGLVLLIACANVANLLLARAASRRREMAIRTAIGASRSQIVRQLLIESLLLAGAGGIAGVILSVLLSRTLVRIIAVDPVGAGDRDDARPARAGVHRRGHAADRRRVRSRAGAAGLARRAGPGDERGVGQRRRRARPAAQDARRRAGRPGDGAPDRRRALRPHAAEPPAGRPRVQHRARGDVRRASSDGLRRAPEARRLPDPGRRGGRACRA